MKTSLLLATIALCLLSACASHDTPREKNQSSTTPNSTDSSRSFIVKEGSSVTY